MDSRERPAKKRKRETKKPKPDTNLVIEHKSPFEPFRTTERAEKIQKQKKSANGLKALKPNSKDRERPRNEELAGSGEDEILESDAEVASDVTSSTAQVFLDLSIAPEVQRAIASMGFSDLKEIQKKSIPPILSRKDVSF